MGTELEKKDTKSQALIDTVRKTIFPNATDPELALFFHRCTVAGVNPLDQLIHPTKFGDGDGGSKVVFITSINLLRSKSSESEVYDGMDEPEYGDDIEQVVDGGDPIKVPEWAMVKIYRKDQSRAAVGKARWNEYYPGQKKGHQWRMRPYLMLAKCAEALARRLAFPDKLNKLYTEEEMMRATEGLAGIDSKGSTKPNVTPDQVKARTPQVADQGLMVGVLKSVGTRPTKTGGTKYDVTIGTKTYSTFKDDLGALAQQLKGKEVEFTISIKGNYQNLESVMLYKPAPAASQPPQKPTTASEPPSSPEVEDAASFASTLVLVAAQKGIDGEANINNILDAEFSCTLDTVPAELQAAVLAHFEGL